MIPDNVYNEFLELLTNKLSAQSDKPEETSQTTLEALWHYSYGTPGAIQSNSHVPLPALTKESLSLLKELIQKRVDGVPLAHLIGKQEFMGIDLLVGSGALIPRKETEILGYAALSKIKELAKDESEIKIIDVCTGMGNLALAFAIHEPSANIWATDISSKAIALAQKNVRNLSLENRVTFTASDMFGPFESEEYLHSFDVITCNPPYISSKKVLKLPDEIIKHEPEEAFNGGPLGFNIIFRLIRESTKYIKKGGWLCFEVGLGQGEVITKIMARNNHFSRIESAKDTKGNIRAILAQVNI